MNYKNLLTKVERTLEQIESAESTRFTIEQIAETIATNFRDELGITGGRIYELADGDNYLLAGQFGLTANASIGMVVPRDYRPIELVRENGVIVMDPTDPGFDPKIESQLGVQRF